MRKPAALIARKWPAIVERIGRNARTWLAPDATNVSLAGDVLTVETRTPLFQQCVRDQYARDIPAAVEAVAGIRVSSVVVTMRLLTQRERDARHAAFLRHDARRMAAEARKLERRAKAGR